MTTIRLSDADRPFVPAADQRQDLADFLAAHAARDARRMQELVASGRVVPLRAGLEVAVRDDGRIVHHERALWVAAA
ncbi:MAG: hypothetical protein RLZZ127_1763 [Planctomycetota bacterium]